MDTTVDEAARFSVAGKEFDEVALVQPGSSVRVLIAHTISGEPARVVRRLNVETQTPYSQETAKRVLRALGKVYGQNPPHP